MFPCKRLVPLSVLRESWVYCIVNLVYPAQAPVNV